MNFNFSNIHFKPIVSRMWEEGKSTAEIGLAIGKSRSTAKRLVKDFGLSPRQVSRGWEARKERAAKPKPPAPEPLGPIGDFPDSMTVCRFPVNADDAPFQCCGHPGFPFCDYHRKRAYTPRTNGRTI